MPTSSIDDLLLGSQGNSAQPPTPEYQDSVAEVEEVETQYPDEPLQSIEEEPDEPEIKEETPEDHETSETKEIDDYGNEKQPENDAIRERLARQARKHQAEIDALRAQLAEMGASRQVQQAAKDFEYDPNESGDWQQQLASFVKQTVQSMTSEQENQARQRQEMEVQREFEAKFRDGVESFPDFADVINSLPCRIDDHMTLATRGMNNPAAFLYAAAKRHAPELERISKMRDPYAKMAEMGKLEERMRRNKPSTNAPRPLGRTVDNSSMPVKEKSKELTIEQLIAASDAKKLNRMKARGGKR